MSSESPGPAERSRVRKAHNKSRAGCLSCKTRRVKCDERLPTCLNCQRRQEECRYPIRPSASSNTPIAPRPQARAEPTPPPVTLPPLIAINDISYDDFEVFHFLIQHTGPSLVDEALTLDFWQHDLPRQAFQDPSLLHLGLSLAGLHMSYQFPARRAALHARADEHYNLALPAMISRVSNPDASSSPSVQMMAMLICFTYLAKGPKSGEYLMFSDDGEAEWYTLFRGARNIIQTSAFVKPKPQATTTPPMGQTPESIQGDTVLDPNFFDRFRRFQEFLSNAAAGEEAFEVPLHALNLLKSTMTARYGFPGNPDDDNHSGVLFSWLYRMSDEFLSTLHQKRPASLVILSFYATLLRDYRPVWVMNDWPDHIKAGVSKYLHPRYQQWVE